MRAFGERSRSWLISLFGAAGFLLSMAAAGLFRLLSGPSDADRMMAAQLTGRCGVGVLLLLAVAARSRGDY